MLIAGYLRYSIQGEFLTSARVLLIAGGVFVAGGRGAIGFRGHHPSVFLERSAQQGTNTTILALAVIAILALLNFVGYRHHKRFRSHHRKALHALRPDPQYRQRLEARPHRRAIRQDAERHRFDDLMAEYKNLSARISNIRIVDPQQKARSRTGLTARRTWAT